MPARDPTPGGWLPIESASFARIPSPAVFPTDFIVPSFSPCHAFPPQADKHASFGSAPPKTSSAVPFRIRRQRCARSSTQHVFDFFTRRRRGDRPGTCRGNDAAADARRSGHRQASAHRPGPRPKAPLESSSPAAVVRHRDASGWRVRRLFGDQLAAIRAGDDTLLAPRGEMLSAAAEGNCCLP